jgi:hypothetical protein
LLPNMSVKESSRSLGDNHSEKAISIFWTGSEEELVLQTIRGCSTANLNASESADGEWLAKRIGQGANELTGAAIESVDGAGAGVVRDQESTAESSEICRSQGETPGLVQRRAVSKVFQESAIFAEDVDVAACAARCAGK